MSFFLTCVLSDGAGKESHLADFLVKEWEMTAGNRIHYQGNQKSVF